MSGPPENIPASELWLKLSSSERPSILCDFPRKGEDGKPIGQLRIRVLTQEEQMAAGKAAEELARKHIKEGTKGQIGYERLFTDAYAVECLFRACRDEKNPRMPFFPSPKDMRAALTTEECSMLFEHYITTQVELGPTALTMSEEEMDAWIDRLMEGGAAFPFDLLSSDLRILVLLRMAYRLKSSLKDSTSAGELLEELSPSSNDEQTYELE